MACGAVLGRVILAMAAQAGSHRMLHQRLGRCGLGHVTMTPDALHVGSDMRRMLKLYQRAGRESVNPIPGNFAFGRRELCNFLDFRLIGRNFGVTQHAFGD